MDFLVTPPEINSLRLYGGAGSGPLLEAERGLAATFLPVGTHYTGRRVYRVGCAREPVRHRHCVYPVRRLGRFS